MPVNLTTQSKVETWLTAPTKDALAGPIVSIVPSQIGEADVVVARQDATAHARGEGGSADLAALQFRGGVEGCWL